MTLHIAAQGEGPDLALVHGWGMTGAIWADIAAELGAHFRVHCVDLPGCGESSVCAPYTLAAVSDALATALPQPLIVCGWSLGAQIALDWAHRYPRQVARLILMAATPRFVRGDGWGGGVEAAVLDVFAAELERDASSALRRFTALQAQDDADARGVTRRLRACALAPAHAEVGALRAGLRILRDADLRARLPAIRQPTLIMHGDRDRLVPLSAGAYLQRALPCAKLVIFDATAHAPLVAHPARCARHIEEFCGER